MNKKVLGLDLGSNSIGWALMNETGGEVNQIIDLGSRIFNKAVEEKVPTPKTKNAEICALVAEYCNAE